MSLEYAILGFLNYQPLSGYDLKKVFDTTVQHFWSADQSQIYRTLARLAKLGWVSQEVIEQNDRPDRKIYHITEAGKTELHRWLVGPLPKSESRNPALIKVFFAGMLTDAEVVDIFEQAADSMRAIQILYQNLGPRIQQYADLAGSQRELFFWLQTLELGKRSIGANLEWTDSVLKTLRGKKVPARAKARK